MIMKTTVAKKVSLYGFFTAAALLFGYVEYLVLLNFIAPGIKLGISNGIVLFLIIKRQYKSALIINVARILLSGFLFATPFSLLFSLTAGIISTGVMILLNNFNKIGFVGLSAVGGVVHNIIQICVAYFTVGKGVVFYLPFLILAGALAGIAVGFLVWIISSKISKNKLFEGIL